jgi:hypothetical protein
LEKAVIAVVDLVRIGMGYIFFFVAQQLYGGVVILRQKVDHVLQTGR